MKRIHTVLPVKSGVNRSQFNFHPRCLDAEKEARDLAKEEQSVTERSYVTTSRVSPSQPFADWPVVVE